MPFNNLHISFSLEGRSGVCVIINAGIDAVCLSSQSVCLIRA